MIPLRAVAMRVARRVKRVTSPRGPMEERGSERTKGAYAVALFPVAPRPPRTCAPSSMLQFTSTCGLFHSSSPEGSPQVGRTSVGARLPHGVPPVADV